MGHAGSVVETGAGVLEPCRLLGEEVGPHVGEGVHGACGGSAGEERKKGSRLLGLPLLGPGAGFGSCCCRLLACTNGPRLGL